MLSIGEHNGRGKHVNANVAMEEPLSVERKISGILDDDNKSAGRTEVTGDFKKPLGWTSGF